MATIQIPNLPAAISVSGTELLEAVQAGVSVRVSIDQVSTFVSNSVVIGGSGVAGGVVGDILTVGFGGVLAQLTPYQIINAIAASLPTADPHVIGQCWLNGEVISVSQG